MSANTKKVVIFGINTLGANALAFYRNEKTAEVAAFTVDAQWLTEPSFHGIPVIPYQELPSAYPPNEYSILVSVGYSDLNRNRERVMNRVREDGYSLASCISTRTNILADSIGENAFIFPGCTIDPYVTIGEGVLICSNTYIAHFCDIGSYSYISGSTTIAGTTDIGHHAIIGCNVTIGHSISLGAFNFLGDGALVRRSTNDYEVFIPEQTPVAPLNSERMKIMLVEPLHGKAPQKKRVAPTEPNFPRHDV